MPAQFISMAARCQRAGKDICAFFHNVWVADHKTICDKELRDSSLREIQRRRLGAWRRSKTKRRTNCPRVTAIIYKSLCHNVLRRFSPAKYLQYSGLLGNMDGKEGSDGAHFASARETTSLAPAWPPARSFQNSGSTRRSRHRDAAEGRRLRENCRRASR